ncbi:MAG TPA: group 1 truncated hemoglobin [Bryobacteraceae bacterium]|nr:group 1 truncated hemoglobin [Bryobacteraceae bacterium]
MSARNEAAEPSLYTRLGGYDVIAAVIGELFALMRADARFARFGARSTDSRKRSQQLTVEMTCAEAGGPCHYIGRDMKTSHSGLGITPAEWDACLELTRAALHKHRVAEREEAEFLSLFERYRAEIVEAPSQQTAGA